MPRNDQQHRNPQTRLKDPDPISLGIAIFAAATGAASLVIQLAERHRGRRQDEQRRYRRLFEVDKGFNRLYESYRELLEVCTQYNVLDAPFAPGEAQNLEDGELREEMKRLRGTVFEAGQNLEMALDDLSELVDEEARDVAQGYSGRLRETFAGTRTSGTIRGFMWNLGNLILALSDFHYEVSERYSYRPSYDRSRSEMLKEIVDRLG